MIIKSRPLRELFNHQAFKQSIDLIISTMVQEREIFRQTIITYSFIWMFIKVIELGSNIRWRDWLGYVNIHQPSLILIAYTNQNNRSTTNLWNITDVHEACIVIKVSFCICAQPMGDNVTM